MGRVSGNGIPARLSAIGAVVALALVCMASAASAASWLPPRTVAKTPEISELQVGRAGDGSATVVYVDRESVWERELRLNGSMSAAQKLAPQYAGEVSLAMTPDGGATVLWVQAGDHTDVARVVHLAPDGDPGVVRNATPRGVHLDAQMAGASDGSAVVVWRSSDGTGPDGIYTRRISPAGVPLGSPLTVFPGNPDLAVSDGEVAVDGDGNATFGWKSTNVASGHDPNDHGEVHTRRWLAGSAVLRPAQAPLAMTALIINPVVVGAANRHSLIAWGDGDAVTTNPLLGQGLSALGVPLGVPHDYSGPNDVVRSAQVALANDGSGGVIYDTAGGGVALRRVTTTGAAGGLLAMSGAGHLPQLTSSPDGAMTAIYRSGGDMANKRVALRTVTGGALSPVTYLSPFEGKIEALDLALGADGNHAAGWVATAVDNTQEAKVSLQAPDPPVCRGTNAQTPKNHAIRVDLNCTGEAQTITIARKPDHGTLAAVNQAGRSVKYTPRTGFVGTDTFTYRAHNVSGSSAVATARIRVGG